MLCALLTLWGSPADSWKRREENCTALYLSLKGGMNSMHRVLQPPKNTEIINQKLYYVHDSMPFLIPKNKKTIP
jgi:hypothetical protein